MVKALFTKAATRALVIREISKAEEATMVTNALRKLALIILLVMLILSIFPISGQAQDKPQTPTKCVKETKKGLGFIPKAITFTSLNIRGQLPEYSLLKGQWILGQPVGTLSPNTCIAIVERKDVGIIQIWYLVKYLKDGQMRSGWVWGGTKDVDDTQYIGGDKTPERSGEQQGASPQPRGTTSTASLNIFSSVAYAQADFMPDSGGHAVEEGAGISGFDEKVVDYYVKVPLLGFTLSISTVSAIILFITMVVGMFAKAIWDQTEGGRIMPPLVKIIRPFLISPIAFSAFWGPMYLQQGSARISLTAAIYAFQIGFMWQHILEKRFVAGSEEKKQ